MDAQPVDAVAAGARRGPGPPKGAPDGLKGRREDWSFEGIGQCRVPTMARNRPSLTELRVLRALLGNPAGPHYGLELIKATGISSGVLYPVLARFETNGWIAGTWEDIDEAEAGRRRRRYYRLTGEGEVAARSLIVQVVNELSLPNSRRARRSPAAGTT